MKTERQPPGLASLHRRTAVFLFCAKQRGLCLHAIVFVGYGQFLTTFGTTGCQYAATVGGSHSFTETVLVSSLSVRGLECSFHCCIFFMLLFSPWIRGAKVGSFFKITKEITHFLSNLLCFLLICITFAAENGRVASRKLRKEANNGNASECRLQHGRCTTDKY